MNRPDKLIDTAKFAHQLRGRAIDVPRRRVLISRLAGSDQEVDFNAPANCSGFGRVRRFRSDTSPGWPRNPLPLLPACKALGLGESASMRVQVFQNAACAWRCWYCFVPENLLKADPKRSAWLAAEELVALYANEVDPPLIIDLSGGSPDLVPEWTLWMMEALSSAGLDKSTYLWSDDNLSTPYLFNLDSTDLDRIVGYRNYGRVGCFKGFDAESFVFNTRATPEAFDQQFKIMGHLLGLGLDLYAYVTLTSSHADGLQDKIPVFLDRLQELDQNLPLRVVPLQIQAFTPTKERLDPSRERSTHIQEEAISIWNSELEARFTSDLRETQICDVDLLHRQRRP
jgi:uncharacterized Fe-S cluster-containing radical SAM superfamily protein